MLEPIGTFTLGQPADLFPTELGSPKRDSFVYLTYAGALADPPGGSGVFDLYEAEREGGGWTTSKRLSRSSATLKWTLPGGVSSDHAYSFSNDANVDYLRDPSGSFELTGRGPIADEPYAQGRYISDGGRHVIFSTGSTELTQSTWCHSAGSNCKVKPLTDDAPPEGTGAVYDRPADGVAHVVSILPGDVPLAAGEQAFYKGTSLDGSSVAFEVDGELYVRVDNGEVGEETLGIAGTNPIYAGLSEEGRYLFYVEGGHSGPIHRLDTETETDVLITPGAEGRVVNVSSDGSTVYFVSQSEIGGEGTTGQPNLYVWRSGSPSKFVATVLPSDLVQTSGKLSASPALTNWTTFVTNQPPGGEQGPGADSSRTTPDGEVLIFESRAQLTSYDNAGYTEIYRYEYGQAEPVCVSCNPSGVPAKNESRLQELNLIGPQTVLRNLSDDGSRAFFETDEALVEGDDNEANDIYEWQNREGEPPLALISSGHSPAYPLPEGWESPFAPLPNLLLSVTPNGSDVYFTAKEALAPGAAENGTQAIYDARIGGGFPLPPEEPSCTEEGCKKPASGRSQIVSGPLSETSSGSGNVKPVKRRCHMAKKRPKKPKRRCAKPHRNTGKAHSSASFASVDRSVEAKQEPSGDGETTASKFNSGAEAASPPPLTLAGAIDDFAIERWVGELSPATAGAHPDFGTLLEFTNFDEGGFQEATAAVEEVSVQLPPGLLGNPGAVPRCSMGDFLSFGNCSPDAQVGVTKVTLGRPMNGATFVEPIYNLAPPHPSQEVARLGFIAFLYPVFIDISVRSATDYGVTATLHDPPGLGVIIRARTTLWGNPAASEHDKERLTTLEVGKCGDLGYPIGTPCLVEGEKKERPSGIPVGARKAFMTNPSACQSMSLNVRVKSYQLPGKVFNSDTQINPVTDCSGLPFAPTFAAGPTSHEAGAPTGLKTKLALPQHLGPDERATATMREARVTLPAGMQVAAGAANWIGTCSDEQVGYHDEVDTHCPDNSKLGTATFVSPALSVPIEGTIYQRSPRPGNQLGLWLTADALGLHIKLPGSLEPDKNTGRLTAVFSDLPQVPVEEIDLNVWGGPRAPLQNPDHCGTFNTNFSFTPHSNDPAVSGQSTMQITEGCNQPFSPILHAGVTNPVAGKFSPFVFDLTRPDGNQALRGFELKLPEGAIGKPKGVPLCSDADAAAGACPTGSRIGSLQATTGPGPDPFTIPEPGKAQPQIYLAGPYKGAPFSIVTEVPAQAGPFDLGVLTVRLALQIDPETARAAVKADPLPQFFEGVGIAYRHLHAVVDRPEFFLNPTDCREMAVTADVTSTQGTVAHPQARFQVDGCKALKFKPKLSLKLTGGTKRADYPALSAVLKARKGDANIAFTSVALPHSEFLAQEHIGTICTRKQFAADKCPKGSVYGKAKAITPLLDKPLSGPVYLRSSDHPLPDLVAKLGGQLEIDLVGRIDSKNGGIRTTFESVPDAPVSKFVLQMRGGKKGLLTNSTDICRGAHRATVQMKAQNGRAATLRPSLVSSGCGKKKLVKKHH
jgi:hypothetical protein